MSREKNKKDTNGFLADPAVRATGQPTVLNENVRPCTNCQRAVLIRKELDGDFYAGK